MYLHEFSKKWINNSILIFGLKLSLFFTHYTSCVYFWIKFIYLTILTSIFFQSGDWGGKINHRFIFLHLYLNCFFVTILLFCPFFNVSVILTRLPRNRKKCSRDPKVFVCMNFLVLVWWTFLVLIIWRFLRFVMRKIVTKENQKF